MKIGVVESDEAVVRLQVRGARAKTLTLHAVVDTGFNGGLVLSRPELESLGLTPVKAIRCVLADGSELLSRVYLGEVRWLGKWRKVSVIEADGGPLLGMARLRGCRLEMDVVDGGSVNIAELPPNTR